jgi:hypothetical protein
MGLRPVKCLILASALASSPALAAETGSFAAEYEGFSHGLLVIKMSAELTLTQAGYSGRLAYHTAGMVGWMIHNAIDTTVTGRFHGDIAVPISFDSSGDLRHDPRVVRMHYADGSPVIDTLIPAVDPERLPVPPELTAHTVDTLAAIASLIRQIGDKGTCDGQVTAFDGRRVTKLTAHTVGDETLPKTGRSIFAGQALRCDFDGDQLAGFMRNENMDTQKRTRHGIAWLAQAVPGGPPVPVKVNFENKVLGQVTLYLTKVSGAPGPVASRGQ